MSLVSASYDAYLRGKCGHLKAKWDNQPSCISCTACLRDSRSICSIWTKSVWNLAEKRRLYSTRKWVMTQKRRQKKSKKTKKSQSDLSDNGSFDGSTAPLSYTARGRTHQGGSLGDLESDRALSLPVTGHPVTGQSIIGQPSIGQPITGQPITGHRATNHRPISHWSSSHWSSSHRSTNHRSTTHRSSSHRSFTHWSTSHQSTSHRSTRHQSTRH